MLSETDKAFVDLIDEWLQRDRTWQDIADELELPLSTLYQRVIRMGYKVGKRLVPIHAEPLDSTQSEAA